MIALFANVRRIDPWLYPKFAAAMAVALCLSLGAPRIALAMALHSLVDFTLQPAWMCAAKARGDRGVLALHSLLAGGLPGWIVGGWSGALIGMATHWAIDSRNKFGLRGMVGLVFDQALHVVVIGIIALAAS